MPISKLTVTITTLFLLSTAAWAVTKVPATAALEVTTPLTVFYGEAIDGTAQVTASDGSAVTGTVTVTLLTKPEAELVGWEARG